MEEIEQTSILNSTKTEYPPCCLRWFSDEFIIVGTYELDKTSGRRHGSLDIFNKKLELLNRYYTSGAILDIKLSPFDKTLIATAHSTGNVILWRVKTEEQMLCIELSQLSNLQVFDTDCLITSVNFSPLNAYLLLITGTNGMSKAISFEKETVLLSQNPKKNYCSKLTPLEYAVQDDRNVVIDYKEKHMMISQHSLECWTSEFGHLSPLQHIIFTGGDDSCLIAHDLRSRESIWSNARIHQAGVVAIKASTSQFRNHKPTSIITGSYDDSIRSIDLRMMGDQLVPGNNVPVLNTLSSNIGGGVWRFIESPHMEDKNKLLVCCMYNGAKVMTIDDQMFHTINYVKDGHVSMCYGGDWARDVIATCSFYDKSLQVWKP